MKKYLNQKIRLYAFIAGSLLVISCVTSTLGGQTVKESRNVSGFTGVSLAFSGDIYVTQGSQFKVEIEADKSDLDIIVSEVDGDVLVLRTKNGHWRNLGDVKAYVTMPEINDLRVTGSGNLVCESAVKTDEIGMFVSGSGNLRLADLTAREIDAQLTGSGDIIVNGSSSENSDLDATITGSGNIKAEGFAVNEATVKITGSGSAAVNVLKELETTITGSGSVNYKGNPLVNANATGSGRTRSIN
jgi:hypothetical protein